MRFRYILDKFITLSAWIFFFFFFFAPYMLCVFFRFIHSMRTGNIKKIKIRKDSFMIREYFRNLKSGKRAFYQTCFGRSTIFCCFISISSLAFWQKIFVLKITFRYHKNRHIHKKTRLNMSEKYFLKHKTEKIYIFHNANKKNLLIKNCWIHCEFQPTYQSNNEKA